MNRKVTVVGGAGAVGATVARAIADRELADVVIIDIADQKAAGIGLDMLEACPIEGSDSRVVGYGRLRISRVFNCSLEVVFTGSMSGGK